MILEYDKVSQVAIVVKDLERSMKEYWEKLGIGPWKIWYLNPSTTSELTYRGKPSTHSFKIGEAMVGDVSIELIEHLEGDTIYKEFLEKKGEGLHHLKYSAEDPEEVIEKFKKEGIKVIQSGKIGKGSYHYFDTEKVLGFVFEMATGQPDRPPDEIYPSK